MSECLFEHKFIGETTTEFSERIKEKYNANKVAICGKLDPMAYGTVRLLLDNNTKFMEQHLNHTKKYEFFLFHGIKTDTDDILGRIANIDKTPQIEKTLNFIKDKLMKKTTQHFHPYSAIKITHNGIRKSLHQWTKENIDVILPEKNANILDINVSEIKSCSFSYYINSIKRQLNMINKNNYSKFNVEESIKGWNKLKFNPLIFYNKIDITVTSGYYIRMIPYYIYKELGLSSHIMMINRIDT